MHGVTVKWTGHDKDKQTKTAWRWRKDETTMMTRRDETFMWWTRIIYSIVV